MNHQIAAIRALEILDSQGKSYHPGLCFFG